MRFPWKGLQGGGHDKHGGNDEGGHGKRERHGGHDGWGNNRRHGDSQRTYDDAPQSIVDDSVPCSGCRTPNLQQARFCQQCGAPMAQTACGQCDATLQAGARFCHQCGKAAS
ncbi:zinc ribbon domain-containing protein [Caballeronia mineralivorans]|uniref:zinc ribbon domain-containing protein n=1 Tax=Caballeronia mineralivorans TaxID=2010198 RepID=UPI0009502409|nr:zinc ribbon domain-containing protein [Caballeronia mineralivorans]